MNFQSSSSKYVAGLLQDCSNIRALSVLYVTINNENISNLLLCTFFLGLMHLNNNERIKHVPLFHNQTLNTVKVDPH